MLNIDDEPVYGVRCAYEPEDAKAVVHTITAALNAVQRTRQHHGHTLKRPPRVRIDGNELAVYYRESDITPT